MSDQPQIDISEITSDLENLSYEVRDNVAIITVDREEALNALNADVLFELGVAFELAEADLEVRALVITGKGRAFVAGADIPSLQKISDPFSGRETSLAGQDVMNTLAALPIPTIAAVNGFALGGGLELALACDMRVAGTKARLGLPEVGLGIMPGYGGTQRLPRPHRARSGDGPHLYGSARASGRSVAARAGEPRGGGRLGGSLRDCSSRD